jgi:cadmium resistance protein CadD (predicted permease)
MGASGEYVFVTYIMFTILVSLFLGIVVMLFAQKRRNTKDKEEIIREISEMKKSVYEVNEIFKGEIKDGNK